MKENKTEDVISYINSKVFFKEFTFSKNDFIGNGTKLQYEFADNVVWLDDIFFIIQIKDRNVSKTKDDNLWFDNKVIKKGSKQIRDSIKFLEENQNIVIENEKGHKRNIKDANLEKIRKIIIYTPNKSLDESNRFLKFKVSSKVGLIHLFHTEDYYNICKYLHTPAEIDEYLQFRESFYHEMGADIDNFPEQYFLSHFFETLEVDHIEPNYINNLKKIDLDSQKFNLSGIIENFEQDMMKNSDNHNYYKIISELAKLNRNDLTEFKKRFQLIHKKCKNKSLTCPNRMYVPRTDCGFVFVSLNKEVAHCWKNALKNFTLAHKYDIKSSKCVGILMTENNETECNLINIYYLFVESVWVFNAEIDKLLKENNPFREVKTHKINDPYGLKNLKDNNDSKDK